MGTDHDDAPKLSLWQRMILRQLRRDAKRGDGAPLEPEDWLLLWSYGHTRSGRLMSRFWRSLPSSPRCGMCGAPFAGAGRLVVRPLGYKPSRKNPHLCATCVELSPPGGVTMPTGILFADLRGFTAASEGRSPEETSKTLRRFYGCAEDVLFPEAIIDKLIGDEVMALYPSRALACLNPEAEVPALMVDAARRLLGAVGYGSAEGPFVEVGIGIDYGEAFVGNIGDRAVYDFTAVGDVVNTASRLQGQAGGGEIVVSARVADAIPDFAGERVELELKGKSGPQVAYRLSGRAAAAPA